MPTTRIADVIAIASSLSGISEAQIMHGPARKSKRPVARVRQAISYVSWANGHSLNTIGRAMGGFNHASILYNIRQSQNIAGRDDKFAAFIAMIAQEADAADPFLPGWHAAQTVPVVKPVLPVRRPKPKPAPGMLPLMIDRHGAPDDAGHRFHRGIAKGSAALLAALQAV